MTGTAGTARQALGTFTVDRFESLESDERDGRGISRARLAKTFRGDLEGSGEVEMLAVSIGDAPAAYVALERVVGSLGGRSGGFILQHTATAAAQTQALNVAVVPGSGFGALSGLHGRFVIEVAPDGGHAYTFDYELS